MEKRTVSRQISSIHVRTVYPPPIHDENITYSFALHLNYTVPAAVTTGAGVEAKERFLSLHADKAIKNIVLLVGASVFATIPHTCRL